MKLYDLKQELVSTLRDNFDSDVDIKNFTHDIHCCDDMINLVNAIHSYGWSKEDAVEILGDILISQD